VGRLDINPRISLPLLFHGWSLRSEVGVDYTLYSQQLPFVGAAVAASDPINRRALKTMVEMRPPALERLFDRKVFGRQLKHVIEPYVVYRRVDGVDNFARILRFDERDILTDTNEVQYGLVNRLYSKKSSSKVENCTAVVANPLAEPNSPQRAQLPWEETQPQPQVQQRPNCTDVPVARELVSWELKQKYFIDTTFGGALVNGARNVFTSSEELTPFAFLTSQRRLSPLVSRLRLEPSATVDAEWDLDYDFTRSRIAASSAFLNYHFPHQVTFGGGAFSLNLPENVLLPNNTIGHITFNQFRTQLQYGLSTKRGFSGAATFGVDANSGLLQYSVIEATYNWDCCGINVEYRRIALGTIRNENLYRFSYTLANIGSFGNLLKRERLY
jgi:LPS-assembly protein